MGRHRIEIEFDAADVGAAEEFLLFIHDIASTGTIFEYVTVEMVPVTEQDNAWAPVVAS